tara:strand:- start:61 stop:423 length:363 start_codon:yes stop_codon:yes gene_type:complete
MDEELSEPQKRQKLIQLYDDGRDKLDALIRGGTTKETLRDHNDGGRELLAAIGILWMNNLAKPSHFSEVRELLRRSYEECDAYFDETESMDAIAYRGFQQQRRDDLEEWAKDCPDEEDIS